MKYHIGQDKHMVRKKSIITKVNVRSFSGNSVEIEKLELPVGRFYKASVMSALNYAD